MISLVFFSPRPAPPRASVYTLAFVRAARAERPRDDIYEFCSRDAPPRRIRSLSSAVIPACPFLCSSGARKGKGPGGGGGRDEFHRDDECRNVRLEARNSMVCSSVRGRGRPRIYAANTCTPGLPESTGVYEISPRSPPGALAAVLSRVRRDLFALHFARFSSRKSASAPPTRRPAPRNTLPPLPSRGVAAKICMRFVGKAKHAAAIIRGKIRCSLASDAASQRLLSLSLPLSFPSAHHRFAYILQRALSNYISPVCRE